MHPCLAYSITHKFFNNYFIQHTKVTSFTSTRDKKKVFLMLNTLVDTVIIEGLGA